MRLVQIDAPHAVIIMPDQPDFLGPLNDEHLPRIEQKRRHAGESAANVSAAPQSTPAKTAPAISHLCVALIEQSQTTAAHYIAPSPRDESVTRGRSAPRRDEPVLPTEKQDRHEWTTAVSRG